MPKTIRLPNTSTYVNISNATAGYLWAKGVITPHPDALAVSIADLKVPMPTDFVIDPAGAWNPALVEVLLGGVPLDPQA